MSEGEGWRGGSRGGGGGLPLPRTPQPQLTSEARRRSADFSARKSADVLAGFKQLSVYITGTFLPVSYQTSIMPQQQTFVQQEQTSVKQQKTFVKQEQTSVKQQKTFVKQERSSVKQEQLQQ